jgi:assimilatory nitrate reductase catalytic subunit
LTTPERCPRSKQPELKHVAVRLLKAELPWTCLGMAWLDEQQVQSVRQALTELMAEFDFASCVLFGRAVPLEKADQGRTGVQFRAAAYAQPGAEVLARLHGLLQLDGPQAMRYADARRQCSRAMAIGRQTEEPRLDAFCSAAMPAPAAGWGRYCATSNRCKAMGVCCCPRGPGRPPPCRPGRHRSVPA